MSVLASENYPLDFAEADRGAVETELARFVDRRGRDLDQLGVAVFTRLLREFLAGGKRVRPLLCCHGWRAAGGSGALSRQVAMVAASLELFHAFALVHDDIMDASTTRRGRPTVHRAFAVQHAGHRHAEQVGVNGALLLGDLALGWSYDLLHDAAPPGALWRLVETMRTETLAGQYLDLTTGGGVEQALRVCRYKTAAYTVQRPLQAGALLAGADQATVAACGEFGLPLGEAFQLRDDLLGVFGCPQRTGKPVLDDLREGKNTVLLALARHHANAEQAALLDAVVGDPTLDEETAAWIRQVLEDTGARSAVEDMISHRCRAAETVLERSTLPLAGIAVLRGLIAKAAYRDH